MDNKLEKIKNIYERRNSSNSKVIRPEFIKNEIENEDKLNNQINIGKRKTSVLEIVAIYEEKLRQCINSINISGKVKEKYSFIKSNK